MVALTLSCLTPSASSSSPGSSMSDWDLPSREYLGRILRAEPGVWQCSGSARGSAASSPSSDLLRGFPASPALLGARKMSLSIERLLRGAPSGSFSHLEPRLDLGFLKAKKFPIFFLRVRELEGARGADPAQVSGAVGLGRDGALGKVDSGLHFPPPSPPTLKGWIQTLETPPEMMHPAWDPIGDAPLPSQSYGNGVLDTFSTPWLPSQPSPTSLALGSAPEYDVSPSISLALGTFAGKVKVGGLPKPWG